MMFVDGAAVAQVAAGDSRDAIAEITVTARKVEERLIDTPVSVTAVTAQDLQNRDITDMRQLLNIAPGLYIEAQNTGRGDRSLHILGIRGVIPSSDSDAEQGASVFIDGAPMNGGQVSGFEDFERVEVLRGPQSAYFGRSTFSGAINFVTKTPGDAFHAKAAVTYGNFGRADGNASLQGAIIPGILRARISGAIEHTDGQYRLFNNPGQRLGAQRTVSLSGTLFFTPSSNFDAKLRIGGWNDNDGPSPSFAYALGNGQDRVNCAYAGPLLPLNGANNWFCGNIPTPKPSEINANVIVTDKVRRLINGQPDSGTMANAVGKSFITHYGLVRHAREASLHMNYRIGDFELSSITAVHRNEWQTLDDIDRRDNALLGGGPTTDSASLHSRSNKDWSQEGRLTSPRDRPLRAMVGASYFDLDYGMTTNFIVNGQVRALNFGSLAQTKTTGIFGSVEYDILANLTASVEGRYQWDDVTKSSPDGTNRLQNTFKSFTPRFSVNYKPGDNLLIYSSYAKGVKPGSFNPGIASFSSAFIATLPPAGQNRVFVEEETLKMGELGFKGQFWGRKLQIQTAAFYGDWRPQANINTGPVVLPNGTTGGFTLIVNTGRVKVWGGEFEVIAVPVRRLTLSGTISYNGSKIKSLACAFCASFNGASLVGRRYAATPKIQASASIAYEPPLTDTVDGFVRLDTTYNSRTFGLNENMLGFWGTPARAIFDVRAGITTGPIRFEGFVKNLFDNDAVLGSRTQTDYAYYNTTPARYVMSATLANRRSYGLRAAYSF